MDIDADSAKVTFPPPFVYLGMLLLGLALDRVLPWSINLTGIGRNAGGSILILAGLLYGLSAAGLFRRIGTDVKPWKSTSVIVAEGVYRFTRNPMYLGMALLYAGLALLFSSLGAILLLPILLIIIQTQVIAREERYLEGKFGDEYRNYKRAVRRWL
ncbi:MAG: isoprenylcysteine carboxylmethyltransferase family protein [Sphingomonadaceae bacterium]|nr:isoprenylcysteine carboxylmethyltransferase family protein [Sphingomonadaceae bacterium]